MSVKIIRMKTLLAVLLVVCSLCKGQERVAPPIDLKVNLLEITKKAIDAQHSKAHYAIEKIEKDERIIIAVSFDVSAKDSYQFIGLTFINNDSCDIADGKNISEMKIDGFGPGGGGYSKRFCVNDLYFKLSFAELLGEDDVSHNIEINDLIKALMLGIKEFIN